MKQAILIDSTATRSQALNDNPNVFVINYVTSFPDGSIYEDTIENIKNEEFFDRLRNGQVPQSAQPSIGEHMKVLDEIYTQGYDVVYELLLGPVVSGIYPTALSVREEYNDKLDIRIFDLKATGGTNEMIAKQVLKAIDNDMTVEEISDLITTLVANSQTYLYISDTGVFIKGGRAENVSGEKDAKQISFPIMYFDSEGALQQYAKTRTEKQVYSAFYDLIKESYEKYDGKIEVTLGVSGDTEKEKMLETKFKEEFPTLSIYSRPLSLGLATHCSIGSIILGIVPLEI